MAVTQYDVNNIKNGNTAPYKPGYVNDIINIANGNNAPYSNAKIAELAPGLRTDPVADANAAAQAQAQAQAAASAQASAEEQAYWNDQLALADQSLGRLSNQRNVGYGNLDSSYNSGLEQLNNNRTAAKQSYDTTRNDTIQDNVKARAGVDDGVHSQLTGLMRLLGSKGAGYSQAANNQAVTAAGTQGNQRRSQIATTFGHNLRDLDNNWAKATADFDNSAADLDVQRKNKRNELDASLAQKEAELQQSKSDAAFNKATASGQAYTQARAARQPYQSRIQSLLGQIDSLGTNISLTPKAAQYVNPNLAQYNYDSFIAPTANAGVSPAAAAPLGAYWNLLKDKEKQGI
jgi:FtsZ-binding cell division protein ZapB